MDPVLRLLLLVGALAALVALAWRAWTARAEDRRLKIEFDRLQDEVWELREAAAARDRAQAASEAKSRFLANVSHEVRTPLNGILGMAEILTATALDPEQQTYVAAIRSSGSALASLIDEILDFSKIEAGKVELAQESFDLVDLVEGVTELLAPRAQGKGLEIASLIAPDVPRRVIGDPVRLRQILLNLAGNGVKFTAEGGVGISLTFDPTADVVSFAIRDTGPGVPAERAAAIFEDFERAGQVDTAFEGGTGLGLAISKRLAERMGGALVLERQGAAAGAHFSLTLPLAREAGDPRPDAGDDLAGRQVLVIAASPFEAPFLATHIGTRGGAARHVRSSEDGLAALREIAFDTVIIDCALGEHDVRLLSETARRMGVSHVFVLFSPFERRTFAQASAPAFDGWLVKPVRRRSLIALLVGSPPAALPSPGASETGRLRVLLAEDNPINAMLAIRHLERLGAAVTHAPDGVAALTTAEAALDGGTPFEAIVLDIRMPGLDGLELARRIRLAEAARKVQPARLVALSADIIDRERRSATLAGVDACLSKPVTLARLAEALRPALEEFA